ncbi:MAG: hypothetical protein KKA79_04655, partial [Nanoarchaeota archaeon]|nr:hypothetical protein [Nanoarchaeota archaeon]
PPKIKPILPKLKSSPKKDIDIKQWFKKILKPKPALPPIKKPLQPSPPKIKPHTPQVVPKPPVKKYIGIKQLFRKLLKPKPTAIHVKKPIDPSPPPKIKPVIKKDKSILTKDTEKLLDYLKKKEKEGLYQLKEEGKKFLDKIESQLQKIKNNTQKELKEKEKEFLDSVKPFVKTKGEDIHPTEEEKRMLSFVEQMKEQNMVHIEKRRLEREKRKLKGPLPDSLKPKLRMKNMQNLAEEEQKIMGKIHKMSDKFPDIQHIKPKKKQKKYDYEWESKADEIKQKRTKKMDELLKEEEKILSKLNKL